MPSAESAVVKVRVQLPTEHVALAGIVETPLRVTLTVPLSPLRTPQAPPTDVTFTLVANGKVTVEPLTVVIVTVGGVVS